VAYIGHPSPLNKNIMIGLLIASFIVGCMALAFGVISFLFAKDMADDNDYISAFFMRALGTIEVSLCVGVWIFIIPPIILEYEYPAEFWYQLLM
jgi:hypothetical protein